MIQYVLLMPLPILFFLVALWSSFHRVADGDLELLLVLGNEKEILKPGVYFVPPFVSKTYTIDLQTMQYETANGRRSIPSALRDEAERIASDRATAAEM